MSNDDEEILKERAKKLFFEVKSMDKQILELEEKRKKLLNEQEVFDKKLNEFEVYFKKKNKKTIKIVEEKLIMFNASLPFWFHLLCYAFLGILLAVILFIVFILCFGKPS